MIGSLFECVVVDNTCFWKNGRIKIRICRQTSVGEGAQDFAINPAESRNYNKESYNAKSTDDLNMEGDDVIDHDDYAELSTCIGGAYDSGLFYLPQPNSHGLIGEIYSAGSNKPRYVWMGALITTDPAMNPVLNPKSESEYITKINMPSDDIDKLNGREDGMDNLSKPENKNHAIIFKQKETYWSKDDNGVATDKINDNEESKKSLNWKEANTLNMAVIDKSRTFITHNMYDKDDNYLGQAHINIDNDNGISIKFNKTEDDKNYTASMDITTDGVARLTSNYNDKIINSFEATSDELRVEHSNKDDKVTGGLVLSKDMEGKDSVLSMSLTQGDKTENIELKKSMINITTSGNITLNPGPNGTVYVGGGSGTNYLLAYPSAGIADSGAISHFESGSLVACKNIRV